VRGIAADNAIALDTGPKRNSVKRKDVPPLVSAFDYDTNSKVVNIGLTCGGDSVQMYMDLRDEEDYPGYAIITTDDGARALGRWFIEYAEGARTPDLATGRRWQWPGVLTVQLDRGSHPDRRGRQCWRGSTSRGAASRSPVEVALAGLVLTADLHPRPAQARSFPQPDGPASEDAPGGRSAAVTAPLPALGDQAGRQGVARKKSMPFDRSAAT
jgi:hypothetical protein